MRFSMLFALTLVCTLSFAFDAQARGRRKRNRDCCPTPVAVNPCCGAVAYGQTGYAGGYAVNSFGVAPAPMSMPMPGVVRTDGTTTQPSTGIVQTSGVTVAPTPQSVTSQAGVGPVGVASNDCCCQIGYGSYVSDTPRRRGLFRNRY